ncbi:unnamed protein product [Dovyalis caffra]|uniref:Uncharacterized protein n=1 Tax=Dovyalis caffra TaxID=77055 RepID=A0AAV1SAF1_9ROSI|nr:unnamed protein product [Dovyalis caffra]
MATAMTLPNYPTKAKPSTTKCVKSAGFQITACAFGRKLYSQCSFVHVAEPYLFKSFRTRAWRIKSSVDSSGLDPSSSNGTSGGTRLVRAIQALQTRLGARIREIRKNLPMKLLFFLVGFYCATAFATVIGQTGDWDILSAALAVLVVEAIGALMYRASFPLVKNIRSLISMFNYWKAGLTLVEKLCRVNGDWDEAHLMGSLVCPPSRVSMLSSLTEDGVQQCDPLINGLLTSFHRLNVVMLCNSVVERIMVEMVAQRTLKSDPCALLNLATFNGTSHAGSACPDQPSTGPSCYIYVELAG